MVDYAFVYLDAIGVESEKKEIASYGAGCWTPVRLIKYQRTTAQTLVFDWEGSWNRMSVTLFPQCDKMLLNS